MYDTKNAVYLLAEANRNTMFEKKMEEKKMERQNKMVETVNAKLGVKVVDVILVEEEGKDISLNLEVEGGKGMLVQLKSMKNQYGEYFKVVSSEEYEIEVPVKEEEKKEEKKTKKFRTKTEQMCMAARTDIIAFASKAIESIVNGLANIKEIEGLALDGSAVRFVVVNNDGTLSKADLTVESIRQAVGC